MYPTPVPLYLSPSLLPLYPCAHTATHTHTPVPQPQHSTSRPTPCVYVSPPLYPQPSYPCVPDESRQVRWWCTLIGMRKHIAQQRWTDEERQAFVDGVRLRAVTLPDRRKEESRRACRGQKGKRGTEMSLDLRGRD